MTDIVKCTEKLLQVMEAGYEMVQRAAEQTCQAVEKLSELRIDERRQMKDSLRQVQVLNATQLARDFLLAVDDFGTLARSDNMNMMMQDIMTGNYASLNVLINQLADSLIAAAQKYHEAKEALAQADLEIDRSSAVVDKAAARAERREREQRAKAEGSAILGGAGVLAGIAIGLVAPPLGLLVGAAAAGGGAVAANHHWNASEGFRLVGQKLTDLLGCFKLLEQETLAIRDVLDPARANLQSASRIIEQTRKYFMQTNDKTPAHRQALCNQLNMLDRRMEKINTTTRRPKSELNASVGRLRSVLSQA